LPPSVVEMFRVAKVGRSATAAFLPRSAAISSTPLFSRRGDFEKLAMCKLQEEESLYESRTPILRMFGKDCHLPFFSEDPYNFQLYLKNEAAHASGSLKHRLAKALLIWGLVNGHIREGTMLVEASSGSTAISEAYFARLLGLPFTAVVAASTAPDKVEQIERLGGVCVKVTDPAAVYETAAEIARKANAEKGLGSAYNMDQFGNASMAVDFRGNNNLAERIFAQLRDSGVPPPAWLVCGLGTGGTAATLGRYCTFTSNDTRVCCVDPENSTFYESYLTGDRSLTLPAGVGSKIEGIGRPRVEPSFVPTTIDRMIKVPDEASVAAMLFLHNLLGHDMQKAGASTGTNVYGCIQLIHEAMEAGEQGFGVVTLLCDNGNRYNDTYYNPQWREQRGFDPKLTSAYYDQISTFWTTGKMKDV